MTGIYKINNLIHGKVYIGQSINISKRWYEHKYKAFNQNDRSYNSALHSAFRKYGIQNFTFEVIEECDENKLDDLEIKYIKEYDSLVPNGYNILSGGQKKRSYAHKCIDCGIIISKQSDRCLECSYKRQRKILNRPKPFELAKMIVETGFRQVGEIYGVTDNAVRKWCKKYKLPYQKTVIKNISKEDWITI